MIAVLDDDFIDFQSFKEPLKKILAPEYHKEFYFFKNHIFQLIDHRSELNTEAICPVADKILEKSNLNLNENQASDSENHSVNTTAFLSQNSPHLKGIEKEELFFQSDIDLILSFLENLQESLSEIEQKSQSLLKALVKYELELIEESYGKSFQSLQNSKTSPTVGKPLQDPV